MNAAAPNLDTAALPYESMEKMRTLVGREMGDANFTSEISRDKWSRLYAALSGDLGATAKAAGPQAEQAWTRAGLSHSCKCNRRVDRKPDRGRPGGNHSVLTGVSQSN